MDPASPSSPVPGIPLDLEVWPAEDVRAWRPRPKFQDRVWLHAALFVATVLTTTLAGTTFYAGFVAQATGAIPALSFSLFTHGLYYAIPLILILGSHEMGHYLACRHYNVDASLPFFLPVPPPVLSGTLGAVIRIREPIPTKRALFDIGIAGPIAGFVVLLPALCIGLYLSNVTKIPQGVTEVSVFGEPLLFKAVSWVLWGTPPDGYTLNLHPIGFAAWFGMLVTALNLFPIGQLDGGHVSYAVLGRRSSDVTLAVLAVAVVLTWFSSSWIVWTGLMCVMLFFFGRHHPRTFDEDVPLDRRRLLFALFAVVMFILCFTPAPLEPGQMIGR